MPFSDAAARAHDQGWFRQVLGQYPTGVSVVTAIASDGAPVALTVGSFTSVSLDPPLVAFLPARQSSSWPKIEAAGRFCVNILGADQEPLCRAFAAKSTDKFAGVGWRPATSGAPVLDGVVAWVDCELDAVYDAGDHVIVVGRVRDLDVGRAGLPLLFFQGGYGRFSPHSLVAEDTRYGAELQLADRARPLIEAVSARTSAHVVVAACDGIELTFLASAGAPADLAAPSAAIGQRLPVVAPVGIWWAAFAPHDQTERWLAGAPVERRDRYREALSRIRQRGYCLGLASVHATVEELIVSRGGPGARPTHQDRSILSNLEVDPLDYVPTPIDRDRPGESGHGVHSLWAPVLRPDGTVAVGVMLGHHPAGQIPTSEAVDALLELTGAISALAAHPIPATRGADQP